MDGHEAFESSEGNGSARRPVLKERQHHFPEEPMNHPTRASRWLDNNLNRRDGRFRLFCFPPAGGGSSFFRGWGDAGLDGIEICPVQLPGRETRLDEPPFTRLRPLVQSL